MLIDHREIRHFHLFCGLGGGTAAIAWTAGKPSPKPLYRPYRPCTAWIALRQENVGGVRPECTVLQSIPKEQPNES